MEFSFTEEQLMIRETAAAFLADKSTSEAVRRAMVTDLGYDADLWQSICQEMFWHAIHIPEEYGGMGLGYVELVALVEQMGKTLLCAPFFSTVALASNALLVAGTDAQKAHYLAQVVDGKTATLAYNGGDRDSSARAVAATYKREGDNFILTGEYHYVVDGHSADILVLAAREEGGEGLSLFVVEAEQAGITRNLTPTMDQTRKQAHIRCDALELGPDALMSQQGEAEAALDKVLDLARIVLAAEQMGGTQAVLDQSVSYTKEREQFGRSIASFQAVKHKAADMMLKAEVSRSAVYYAACVAQEALFANSNDEGVGFAAELTEAAAMSKAYCSDSYFYNAGTNMQLHGGVGFTWEYDVHLYFKRAKASEMMLGNGAYHRENIAANLLDS